LTPIFSSHDERNESGGTVMTSHIWLAPAIPELKEIQEFHRRYAEALQGPFSAEMAAEQMTMAMAMYPAMKDMMGKMEAEKVNMEGAQILTEAVMETVLTAEQAAAMALNSSLCQGATTAGPKSCLAAQTFLKFNSPKARCAPG
jgi:hypothetical protein